MAPPLLFRTDDSRSSKLKRRSWAPGPAMVSLWSAGVFFLFVERIRVMEVFREC